MMPQNICPNCGRYVEESYNICPACGAGFNSICQRCGREIKTFWSMCPNCGYSLKAYTPRGGTGEGPPQDPSYYVERARELQSLKQYKEALECVLIAKRIRPFDSETMKLEESIRLSIKAEKYDNLVSKGYEYEKQGELSKALFYYKKATTIYQKESLLERIEYIQNKSREAEVSGITRKAYEHENNRKYLRAFLLYKKALKIIPEEEISLKVDRLRGELSQKYKRYGKWGLIIAGCATVIAISLIIVFSVIGDEQEKTSPAETKLLSLTISSPMEGQEVSSSNITVAGKTEPRARVNISFKGGGGDCNASSTGSFTTVVGLPDESATIEIKVKATTDEGEVEKSVNIKKVENTTAVVPEFVTSNSLPPLPEYITAEEQWALPSATGPVWSVTLSSESIGRGGSCNLYSQWYHCIPSPGNEMWFLVETPSGNLSGERVEVVGGEWDKPEFAGQYEAVFPYDFEGANTNETGQYRVYFVNYSIEYDQVSDYACAAFQVN